MKPEPTPTRATVNRINVLRALGEHYLDLPPPHTCKTLLAALMPLKTSVRERNKTRMNLNRTLNDLVIEGILAFDPKTGTYEITGTEGLNVRYRKLSTVANHILSTLRHRHPLPFGTVNAYEVYLTSLLQAPLFLNRQRQINHLLAVLLNK